MNHFPRGWDDSGSFQWLLFYAVPFFLVSFFVGLPILAVVLRWSDPEFNFDGEQVKGMAFAIAILSIVFGVLMQRREQRLKQNKK